MDDLCILMITSDAQSQLHTDELTFNTFDTCMALTLISFIICLIMVLYQNYFIFLLLLCTEPNDDGKIAKWEQ